MSSFQNTLTMKLVMDNFTHLHAKNNIFITFSEKLLNCYAKEKTEASKSEQQSNFTLDLK